MRWRSAISPTGCAAAAPIVQAWPRDERVLTPRRAAGAAAASRPPWLRRRRAERAARQQDPRRGARFPGAKRPGAGRLCLGGDPGAAAGALTNQPSGDLQVDIFAGSNGPIAADSPAFRPWKRHAGSTHRFDAGRDGPRSRCSASPRSRWWRPARWRCCSPPARRAASTSAFRSWRTASGATSSSGSPQWNQQPGTFRR